MAIVTETYELSGRQFIRTYSDDNRFVVGGEPYGEYPEANDPADLNRIYVEGGSLLDDMIAAQAEEVVNILTGGESK